MGVHWFDVSDTSLVPGANDFQHILLNGSWDGRHTFYEPMITTEFLMSGPDVEQPLKQPQAFRRPRTTRPPTPSTSMSRQGTTSSRSPE